MKAGENLTPEYVVQFLQEENERLREALQEILQKTSLFIANSRENCFTCSKVYNIAKEALEASE